MVLPRVYLVEGWPLSWVARAVATSLWAGTRSALSHQTAAALWRFDDFSRGPLVVSTARCLRPRDGIRVRRVTDLGPADVARRGPMTLTSVSRTLQDLAATEPLEKVEAALDQALATGMVSLPKLRWFVQTHAGRGRPGSGVLKELIAARPPGYVPPESPLESRVWNVIVRAGLPRPIRQYEVRLGAKATARLDLAYPDLKVAVEADGYRWHAGRGAWSRDLSRRNRLTSLGWRVLHVTHDDLARRPADIVAQIDALLRTSCGEAR